MEGGACEPKGVSEKSQSPSTLETGSGTRILCLQGQSPMPNSVYQH